jgi:hypothetical protein
MGEIKRPHAQDERRLCLVQNIGTHRDRVNKLVRNPKFICKGCGRVAAEGRSLWVPGKI